METFSWKIGGPAGYGIKASGNIFAKSIMRSQKYVFAYYEYPSLVRGGHNTCNVEISNTPVNSYSEKVDLLVALDELTLQTDLKYLHKNSVLIYDEKFKNKLPKLKAKIFSVPLSDIANKLGKSIMRNSVALGASQALMGIDEKTFTKTIKDTYKNLGEAIIKLNIKAVQEGYNYIKNTYNNDKLSQIQNIYNTATKKSSNKKALFITGNEAMALGAIKGECKFFSAYPMTPATYIMHYLHEKQREANLVVHQAEDEISASVSALGASFAGSRSMVATSGGGFALMNEALSLAGIIETGIVIANVMRPAPATGLPTWTEQGDLNYILNAGHGDFPRVVLAPGDPEEAFNLTALSFNLSDKYQLPVMVLSDKFLAESFYTWNKTKNKFKINKGKLLTKAPKNYKRYMVTKDGVSPRTIPGIENGEFIANSDEHNEYGLSVEGYDNDRVVQMQKRMKKLETVEKEFITPKLFGPSRADLTIIGWGSSKGPITDALKILNSLHRKKVNYLHFSWIYPLPIKKIKKLLRNKNLVLVENNYSGQFGKLLKQELGIEITKKILKYDGKPLTADEIFNKIKKY